jgi:Acyl-CoA reductase (LuxC)
MVHATSSFRVPFVVQGSVVTGSASRGSTRVADWDLPDLDLDGLVWPTLEPTPLFHVGVAEIIDLLAELSDYLHDDRGGYLADALESLVALSSVSRPVFERGYAQLWRFCAPEIVRFQLEQELGGADVVDGWREVTVPNGTQAKVRAFPGRIVHIMAGNAPGVGMHTIVRGALTKGVHLLKLPSNDMFTAPALLRSLNAVAPGHPITRSFSAVYWRGGDSTVESVLLRSQFFDKVVVWGGGQAVRGIAQYIGPGLELVAFDPKTSISLIGHDAFASDDQLRAVAAAAATDATLFNQDACTASRYQFVEGSPDEVDRYCELLVQELGLEREVAAAKSDPVPADIRVEIDSLRSLAPFYRVWGSADGTGMVIRSDEPVEFYPSGRVVNVVRLQRLDEATQHVTAATQTVGIYPASAKEVYRDRLCAIGVQRVVTLGSAGVAWPGLPHDGFYPMQRFVRWGKDEP